MDNIKTFYKRNLPHIQPFAATFFVTCSLKGAIPKNKLQQVKENYIIDKNTKRKTSTQKEVNYQKYFARKKYLLNIDNLFHNQSGPHYLDNPKIARILLDRLEAYDNKYYELIALTIMPNHFHMLIDTSIQLEGTLLPHTSPKNYIHLQKIMHLIKGGSSRFINQMRKTTGEQVWENESFDIYIRNEKMLRRVINYILDNPIKAGIVKSYEDHPFTFVKDL